MPAPASATYSAAAKVAANTELRDLLDAGAGPGKVFFRSEADVLLAEVPLNDPSGTVDGGTGQLTLVTTPLFDTSADASGVATYCEFADSDDTVHLSLPTSLGSVAESGYVVMNTTTIIAGGPVAIFSAVIG